MRGKPLVNVGIVTTGEVTTEGGVLDLVFSYNKGLEKKVKGSCLVKDYGCLAPSAVSTLSQR